MLRNDEILPPNLVSYAHFPSHTLKGPLKIPLPTGRRFLDLAAAHSIIAVGDQIIPTLLKSSSRDTPAVFKMLQKPPRDAPALVPTYTPALIFTATTKIHFSCFDTKAQEADKWGWHVGADGSQNCQSFCSEQCKTQTVAKATITRSQHDYMLLRHCLQNALF